LDDQHSKEGIVRKLDRREFVIGAGGAALAGAVSPVKVFAQAAAPQQVVRRAIGTMQPNDPALVSYFRAVERMKALPASDPRNWNRIAQIHVDFCPHGNWFFLPWHRAYLVSFERICRQMSGDPNFALPYWDWTQQRQLPPAFTSPTLGGRRNALFNNTRQVRPNSALRDSAIGRNVITRIMGEPQFENFGSTRPAGQNSTDARWLRTPGRTTALEGGPHNTTHVFVGGDMGDMISPRDPLFWLHHCNIDRLWAQWNALGRRNTANRLWTTFRFNGMFQIPQGQRLTAWNVGVSDVLDHRAFGYTYPDLPSENIVRTRAGTVEADAAEADLPEPRVLASEAPKGSVSLNKVLSAQMILTSTAPISGRANEGSAPTLDNAGDAARKARDANDVLRSEAPVGTNSRQAADDASTAGLPDGRVFSVLENIRAAKGNATMVNVFLNHPSPTANTPEDDPHFVGTFGVFGLQSHAAHEGLNVQVELSETVAKLRQVNRAPGKRFDLQLVPVEAAGDELELNLGRIDIVTL
jgi:tyrosinase